LSEWALQWRTVRARYCTRTLTGPLHGLSALPSHEELVAHSAAHHPHLHLSSLSLSLSLPLFPFPFLPLLYFSFLSKRRKGLVLTFSSSPPSPPLPFHHSAFGSPIAVVSSSTPCPPLCVRFLLFAWGVACFRHCRYYISYISNLSQKYGFLFLLGFYKIYSFFFFCFLSFIMACL
jgi:hypothetical protein